MSAFWVEREGVEGGWLVIEAEEVPWGNEREEEEEEEGGVSSILRTREVLA